MSAGSDFYAQRMSHRCQRAEQLEREATEAQTQLEIAEAVAGPEPAIRTDGSGDPDAPDDGRDEELPSLHVGDHVIDRDNEDRPTMVVVGLPLQRAASYEVKDGQTVADKNPDYAPESHVIEVVFPQRTDVFLGEKPKYGYPRPRLKLEQPIHDRDDEEGEQ